ncbi:protein L10 [Seminavis robusta]|uniref:Protein L10 n=1 Tax=Seminavis robusta TaxID=568900 RepID=A0A9N8HZJ9_9STRA|nr:protein L10 [Seminavis robusta]|eukprot:Sro2946_g340780.1 protein L10 (216) ;mRNA; r:7429-8076
MYRLLFLLPCVAAFMGQPLVSRTSVNTQSSGLFMGGASGYATSLPGKQERVEKVKELLDSSQMIVTVPCGGMTVTQSQQLRQSMPEGTTVMTVKNKLMQRSLEGSEYEAAGELLKGSNMWFFIDEDIGASIKAFNAFTKEQGKQESHEILGGVMEGTVYDQAGVKAIGDLPSKQDLYAMIAGSIKAVPTKVARVIKAPNSKLARAIKLAGEKAEN